MTAYQIYNNLLTKTQSYGLPLEKIEKSNVFTLRAIIINHEQEQNDLAKRMLTIQSIQNISKQEQESIERAKAAIARVAQRIQDSTELSEWQLEILEKTQQYKLSYNQSKIDWFKLSDTIDELEMLIPIAKKYGIDNWDANDLVNLEQRIEDAEHTWYTEKTELYRDYISSRL